MFLFQIFSVIINYLHWNELSKKILTLFRTRTHTHTHIFMNIYVCIYLQTIPLMAGCKIKSILKQSTAGLNSEVSIS